MEAEYAAKYLEQLGANPSLAAQDIVRKALPLSADCLQVKLKVLQTCTFHLALEATANTCPRMLPKNMWQAAGHKESEVLVVPPAYQAEILPIQEADPQDVVRLGFVGTLGKAAEGTDGSQVRL